TLRYVKSLGDSVINVLGNHDLHLIALASGKIGNSKRFETLHKILKANDRDELIHWLRHKPLAHYDKSMDTLLVHAGTHPSWTVKKTLARAAEVEAALQGGAYKDLLAEMYGNTPRAWSGKLKGHKRLRFIINCLTRMRMITDKGRLNFAHSGPPHRARKHLVPWFEVDDAAWWGTRVVFGHWSALGLVVLPDLVSLDSGCIWGRQLTALRLDSRVAQVYQVPGQI
ncbi:MAG: symmetrical bis(5'-nucleosyl)-tetraphosphatase, partial [Gammaproteobacteria bacterium]|nr:symmetrical bis(5'-nucleosyl)-tetraphosphatase [Gammaproteobacteria bacterium]